MKMVIFVIPAQAGIQTGDVAFWIPTHSATVEMTIQWTLADRLPFPLKFALGLFSGIMGSSQIMGETV